MKKSCVHSAAVFLVNTNSYTLALISVCSRSVFSKPIAQSNAMDFHRIFNITHPSIQGTRKYSLYHSETLRHTVTHNEFMDNVLVATSLFLLVILLKDIITRIVYMQPRFSVADNTITYFSQARIVLLDNSFLLRWVRKFRLFDAGHYNQRNHMQYNLVMLATLAMFVVELGLVVTGLPANRQIYRDSDKMVRWESEYLDKGRVILSKGDICAAAPVLDGPNVVSESSWSHCNVISTYASSSAKYPADKLILKVPNPEKFKGYIDITLLGESFSFFSRHVVYIPLDKERIVMVGLSDNATTFVRNLRRNFDLLRNVTGLTLTFLPEQSSDILTFQVNASHVTRFAFLENATNSENAGLWVAGIIQGMLNLRGNVNGSQLYVWGGFVNRSRRGAVPLRKQKIIIGAYIGTLVPAFFIAAFTTCIVLVHIVVCFFLKSPPGGSWELLQAHGRDQGDRILSGPPGDLVEIHEKCSSHEEI